MGTAGGERSAGVCHDSAGAARGTGGALAQAARDDDRGAAGRGHGRRCGVESADAGVAERRALLSMAMDLDDRVIKVTSARSSIAASSGACSASAARNRDATAPAGGRGRT